MKSRFFTISKPLIILFFVFVTLVNLNAQNITWFKVYDGPSHMDDAGNIVCKADGENFLVAGYTHSIGDRIYVMKINQYGDTLFTKIIGNMTTKRAFSMVPDNAGNFYITGDGFQSAFVIKINLNGDVIWEKHYTDNTTEIDDSKVFSDNSLVSCGRGGKTGFYGYIQKIDSSGNLQWSKNISVQYKYLHSVEEDFNGNIIVVGSTTTGFIIKYTPDGDFIYERQIFSGLPVKIRRISGGYIVAGKGFQVTKLDTACNFLNIKYFNTPDSDEEMKDFQVINNNQYYMCGYSNPNSQQDTGYGKILIADSSGTILHSKFIPNAGFIRINFLYLTVGGDIVFTGYRELMTTSDDILIFRTNQNLEGPTVGIIQTQNIIKGFALYQNYPNPFNPVTKIKFDIPKLSDVKLIIFDAVGREIKNINQSNLAAGSYEYEFNGESLSSGIYFYSLQFGDNTQTKKMVFVK